MTSQLSVGIGRHVNGWRALHVGGVLVRAQDSAIFETVKEEPSLVPRLSFVFSAYEREHGDEARRNYALHLSTKSGGSSLTSTYCI